VYRAYILSKSARSPRFRTERENWVQRVVADGHAICILPERSAAAPGLVTRPIEGLFGAGIGDRDGLGIDHSGRDYGRSRNSPRCTNGSEDRRSSAPAAMETILAAHWKTSSRAAMSEDDACTLGPGVKKCNPRNLSPDTAYTRQRRRGCVVGGACAANNTKREEPYASQDAGDDN
jgi:hypothetical protein